MRREVAVRQGVSTSSRRRLASTGGAGV